MYHSDSDARYRSLVEGAAYGIYRSTIDGTILDANPAFARMLGYDSVDEVTALKMTDVYMSPAERQALVDQYRRGSNQTLATEIIWRRKDGTPIIVRLTARVVDFDNGSCCFEGIAEDITARRALEGQLRQAQKMEAVGRLARVVAHDFNNVLTAIIGGTDLLSLRLPPGDPAREDVDEIRLAAERGAALTRQLLAFSRNEAIDVQVLDLNVAVQEMIGMLQRLAGEGVTVSVHTSDAPVHVRIEPSQLEQVLMNLAANARDAMPGAGTIDIGVEAVTLDKRTVRRRYPAVAAGPYARMTVRDTGSGIDPAVQPYIFEPFFTTKDPSKGTGLGLAIVYRIATECGGTVTFSSSDRGTTFEVLLPLLEAGG